MNVQRVGRGNGSKRGKTSCRGEKGDKSRSGYKRRYGLEGGQLPLYRRIPCRGFTNGRFKSKVYALNLADIERAYQDGEKVCVETLLQKGLLTPKYTGGVKILGNGELKKKVDIEVHYVSQSAQEKLRAAKVNFTILTQ